VYGIPKPSYRAFQLLHWTGDKLVQTVPDTLASRNETLGVFAIAGDTNISVFLVNWNIKGQPIAQQDANVTVSGLSNAGGWTGQQYRIDSIYANAYPTWVKMGMPKYLTPRQVGALKEASTLVANPINLEQISSDTVSFRATVPANTVVNVVLMHS